MESRVEVDKVSPAENAIFSHVNIMTYELLPPISAYNKMARKLYLEKMWYAVIYYVRCVSLICK